MISDQFEKKYELGSSVIENNYFLSYLLEEKCLYRPLQPALMDRNKLTRCLASNVSVEKFWKHNSEVIVDHADATRNRNQG